MSSRAQFGPSHCCFKPYKPCCFMFDENSNSTAQAATLVGSGTTPIPTTNINSISLANQLLTVKDSRWLQLEVCREFQRGQCSRSDVDCKFAHPPAHVDVQNGRVTACYDSIKVGFKRNLNGNFLFRGDAQGRTPR